MRLHTQPRKFLAMQPPRRIIPNLPRIPRLQSPHCARRHGRRHLSPRQHIRRPKRHLRPAFRILRHRNNRVRSVQPNPNQIHSRPHLHPTHSSSLSVSSANSVVNSLLFSSLLFSFLLFSFLCSALLCLNSNTSTFSLSFSYLFPFNFKLSTVNLLLFSLLPKPRRLSNHDAAHDKHRNTHHRQRPRRHPTKIHPRHSRHRRKINKHSRRRGHQNPIQNPSPCRDFPFGRSPIHPRLNKLLLQVIPLPFASRRILPLHLLRPRRRRKRNRP